MTNGKRDLESIKSFGMHKTRQESVRGKGQKISRRSTFSLRQPVVLSLFKSYEGHKRDKGQTD